MRNASWFTAALAASAFVGCVNSSGGGPDAAPPGPVVDASSADATLRDVSVPDAQSAADAGDAQSLDAADAADAPGDLDASDAATDAAPSYGSVTDLSRWESFDLSQLPTVPAGLEGAVYDGRHIYYVPYGDGFNTPSGLTVRYDTQAPFKSASSWEEFDMNAQLGALGYSGGVFDGRYVYFIPANNNGSTNRVVRYDTNAVYTTKASWETYDLPSASQFAGAAFDGRYIYTSPYNSTVVACFDTTVPVLANGWTYYDVARFRSPSGFGAPSYDGHYVYFAPLQAGAQLVRYDTTTGFMTDASWSSLDMTTISVHAAGYQGSSFDGRHITFAPSVDSVGFAAQYDTTAPLEAGSFGGFTISSLLDGGGASYCGSEFDGRFIYFAPLASPFAQFDTTLPIDAGSSWSLFDAVEAGVVGDAGTAVFCGGAFDGQYVYFAPLTASTRFAVRYNAKTPASLPPRIGSFF